MAESGLGTVVGLDLVIATKDSGLYSGGGGEPLMGLEEHGDTHLAFARGQSSPLTVSVLSQRSAAFFCRGQGYSSGNEVGPLTPSQQ